MKYIKIFLVTCVVVNLTYVLGVTVIRSALKKTTMISELSESTRIVFEVGSFGFVVAILGALFFTFLAKYLKDKYKYWISIVLAIVLGTILTFMGN